MTINRNNFEAYLLDYLEGNLDPLLTADLMAFLAENPEYEKYVPDGENQALQPILHPFPYKNKLRKDFEDVPGINEMNFDEFCIAESEGMLSIKDVDRLDEYSRGNVARQKNRQLYAKLKLQADQPVVCPYKDQLYRKAGGVKKFKFLAYGLAIAASFALVLLLTLDKTGTTGSNSLSTVTSSEASEASPRLSPRVPAAIPGSDVTRNEGSQKIRKEFAQHPDPAPSETGLADPKEILALLPVQPVTRKLEVLHESGLPDLPQKQTETAGNTENSRTERLIDSQNLITTLLSKVNVWKTAETALSGFNYLTEAELSINRSTDDKGRITGIRVNTESYTIAGKLR